MLQGIPYDSTGSGKSKTAVTDCRPIDTLIHAACGQYWNTISTVKTIVSNLVSKYK